MKAVGLTSGGLPCVPESGLKEPQGFLIAAQESAKGVVGGSIAKGPNGARLRRRVNDEASTTGITWASSGRISRWNWPS